MYYKIVGNKIYIKNNYETAYITATLKENSIYIELLKVEPKHRNKSLAKTLLEKSLMLFKTKGFKEVSLNALPLDVNGLNMYQLKEFYKKLGFFETVSYEDMRPNFMKHYL